MTSPVGFLLLSNWFHVDCFLKAEVFTYVVYCSISSLLLWEVVSHIHLALLKNNLLYHYFCDHWQSGEEFIVVAKVILFLFITLGMKISHTFRWDLWRDSLLLLLYTYTHICDVVECSMLIILTTRLEIHLLWQKFNSWNLCCVFCKVILDMLLLSVSKL